MIDDLSGLKDALAVESSPQAVSSRDPVLVDLAKRHVDFGIG